VSYAPDDTPEPETIARRARALLPDRIRRQFVVVRSVERQGVSGDLLRHVVVVDADGQLDPQEMQRAIRRHFADPKPAPGGEDRPEGIEEHDEADERCQG